MVLRAGELAGCPVIDELVFAHPMVLVEQAPTDLQITVHPADQHGRRSFTVHSRPGGQQRSTAWTLHASGTLRAQPAGRADPPAMSPPPEMGVLDFGGFEAVIP